MNALWSWPHALDALPVLLRALQVTVAATVAGMSLALVLGLVLALMRRSPRRLLSWPAAACVEFVRNTPLLVQIFFLFYVLPRFGVSLSPFLTGALALGIHYSTYASEVYRAGIGSVPRGQWEAAHALGLGPVRAFSRVILPQALPPVVPALGNYLVAMFKDTPLLSTITVLELLYAAKDLASESFRYVEPLTLAGLLLLALSLLSARGIRALERRLRIPGSR